MKAMQDTSVAKLGGAGAILVGVCTALGAITYLFLPPEQRVGAPGAQLLPSFAQSPTLLETEFWELALIGVLGLVAVPGLARLAQGVNEGWLRLATTFATIGFAVQAIGNFLTLGRLPKIAEAYVSGDASTKAALVAVWKSSIDPQGFWEYGAIGLWVFVLSLLTLRNHALPRPLAYLGLALGVLHWVVPVAILLDIQQSSLVVVAVLGAILGPIWYIWAGLVAWRNTSRPSPARTS
jgi:hypothetical protein